jgi:hypothetical protein
VDREVVRPCPGLLPRGEGMADGRSCFDFVGFANSATGFRAKMRVGYGIVVRSPACGSKPFKVSFQCGVRISIISKIAQGLGGIFFIYFPIVCSPKFGSELVSLNLLGTPPAFDIANERCAMGSF